MPEHTSLPLPRWAIGPLFVALILSACAGVSGAPDAPSASAEPTASPTPTTFTSERYGYSLEHPGGWEMLERPGELQLAALRPRHPGTDTLGPPESHEFDILDGVIVIGARDLGEGETLEDFTDEASAATLCGPHGKDTATLGGEPAEVRKFECGGTRWHQLTALHDGRGYLVWVTRPLTADALESFAFTD